MRNSIVAAFGAVFAVAIPQKLIVFLETPSAHAGFVKPNEPAAQKGDRLVRAGVIGPVPSYALTLTHANGLTTKVVEGQPYADCRILASAYVSENNVLIVQQPLGNVRVVPMDIKVSCVIDGVLPFPPVLPETAPLPTPRDENAPSF
jgi:hypothetical protein